MSLLEQHFDVAFAAPDGIKKLRELILTLAMQGKLVPQDPNDETASELLRSIEADRNRLIKEGKIKQSKPLPEVKTEEITRDLPDTWKWLRLGDFGMWKSGTTPSRTNSAYYGGEIPWVKSGEVKQGKIRETEETITQEALKNCSLALNPIGSILIAMYGANIGEVGVLEIEATTNQAVCACKTYFGIDNIFLLYLIISLKQNFNAQGAGAAQPNISKEKIINTLAPLPPLAEQRRIVAKIDQLMARCDELEKLRIDRSQRLLTVHTAALDRLLTAKDSSEFSTAWSFITQHFGELYSVKENVVELRKTILQLAVMGKLVRQDPNDEPASELLRSIELEKQRLVKEGKIKDMKPLPLIDLIDLPSKIPDLWQWTRIETICEVIVDCPHSTAKFIPDGIICIDTNSFKGGEINYHKLRYVSEETYLDRINRLSPQAGDVIFAREGSVGESVIIPSGMECCLGQRVMLFRPTKGVLSRYLQLSISNPLFLTTLLSVYKGIGAKHVNVKDMRNALISLPPLAEQRRIMEKIDRLMGMCDRLEESILSSKGKQTDLLNALMSQV